MRSGLIYGVGLWAILTLGFKLVIDGDIVRFDPATLRILLPLFGAVVAVVAGITLRIVEPPEKAALSGIGLAVAGMMLGCTTLLAFGHFIARPSMEHGVVYAVFILWTYGLVLSAVGLFCASD